jgi:hypothetical protein
MFIDFASTPPDPRLRRVAPHLANYRRVYAASERAAGRDKEALGAAAIRAYVKEYARLGARRVVVKARDLETTFGFKIRNEDVADFCRRQGPRFVGFAGVDPRKGMAAIRELEHAVTRLGLRGLNLQCFEHRLDIDDPRMFPLYAKCIELGVPVNIHSSINFSTATRMDHGHPLKLDAVMVHFPELKVIASPPGWPWVKDLIGVAWRHPNVFIGLLAIRHKYLGVANSGYEELLQYGNTVLQDRMIFGTAYPMVPVARALDEIAALPLKAEVREKWLWRNAERLLGCGQGR